MKFRLRVAVADGVSKLAAAGVPSTLLLLLETIHSVCCAPPNSASYAVLHAVRHDERGVHLCPVVHHPHATRLRVPIRRMRASANRITSSWWLHQTFGLTGHHRTIPVRCAAQHSRENQLVYCATIKGVTLVHKAAVTVRGTLREV